MKYCLHEWEEARQMIKCTQSDNSVLNCKERDAKRIENSKTDEKSSMFQLQWSNCIDSLPNQVATHCVGKFPAFSVTLIMIQIYSNILPTLLPSQLSHIDAENLSNISVLPMLTSNEGWNIMVVHPPEHLRITTLANEFSVRLLQATTVPSLN